MGGTNDPSAGPPTLDATVDLRVYRLSALKKAAYRLADRVTVVIGAPEGDLVHLDFRFSPGTSEVARSEAIREFFQELVDQELREQIAEETAPVRTLIIAHALSKADLIERK
jgi:His-Xaa-Ser system protein HxsD